jgi:hypothetical protein
MVRAGVVFSFRARAAAEQTLCEMGPRRRPD